MFFTLLCWQCRCVLSLSLSHWTIYLSYLLVDSIFLLFSPMLQPRMLLTVDENLKPLSVPVRVGQAVDVVGQAGRPKTITGFQTHSTPVLLAAGDRAELATEKYYIYIFSYKLA